MKFSLLIDSDNQACQNIDDLLEMLNRVRASVNSKCGDLYKNEYGKAHGKVLDINGNSVGYWEVEMGEIG